MSDRPAYYKGLSPKERMAYQQGYSQCRADAAKVIDDHCERYGTIPGWRFVMAWIAELKAVKQDIGRMQP